MTEPVKLCKDCRFCRPSLAHGWFFGRDRWEFAACWRPHEPKGIELVDGKSAKTGFCAIERDYYCGTKAAYFEPKRPLRTVVGR